jgi:FAD/FMN-containing dehydrogenase
VNVYGWIKCYPEAIVRPSTTQQLADAVRQLRAAAKAAGKQLKLRVSRTRFHGTPSFVCPGSFSGGVGSPIPFIQPYKQPAKSAAAPSTVAVLIDDLKEVLTVDRSNYRVTVQAGLRVDQLLTWAEANGMAMERGAIASYAELSIAGVLATGGHGTGHNVSCNMVGGGFGRRGRAAQLLRAAPAVAGSHEGGKSCKSLGWRYSSRPRGGGAPAEASHAARDTRASFHFFLHGPMRRACCFSGRLRILHSCRLRTTSPHVRRPTQRSTSPGSTRTAASTPARATAPRATRCLAGSAFSASSQVGRAMGSTGAETHALAASNSPVVSTACRPSTLGAQAMPAQRGGARRGAGTCCVSALHDILFPPLRRTMAVQRWLSS